ncbi:MAG: nitroreductase family protein, partial [Candidatus Hodarchaeales archaeon]
MMIEIDTSRCSHCGYCVNVCPAKIFIWKGANEGSKRTVVTQKQENCIACGHCVAICPSNAIIHEQLPGEQFHDLDPIAISSVDLHNLLSSRRSIRAYKRDPVPHDVIDKLLNAAVHAGTASNLQNLKFTVIQDQKLLQDVEDLVIDNLWKRLRIIGNPVLRKLIRIWYSKKEIQTFFRYYRSFKESRELNNTRGMIFRGAPVVIMVDAPGKDSLLVVNCALACANMTMMAQTLGIGTCWVGFLITAALKESRIKKVLG